MICSNIVKFGVCKFAAKICGLYKCMSPELLSALKIEGSFLFKPE